MANFGVFTTDDTSIREDLLSILKDVSPNRDNWLFDNLGSSVSNSTVHQWLVYNTARKTANNNIAEGADFSLNNNPQPTRSTNLTAIVRETVMTSFTERQVKVGLPGDPMDFQKLQALRRLTNQIEYTVMNGSKISGASGTAAGMAGLLAVISTNVTAIASGATLTTTELENLVQASWNAVGAEYVGSILLTSIKLKQKIATFTTRVTSYVDATDHQYANITMYDTSAGTVTIVPHKDLPNGAGTSQMVLINPDMYKIAYLRKPQWYDIARVGSADRGMYEGELTLESLAERASVITSGFTLTGS